MGEQMGNSIKEHLQIHEENKDKEKKMKLFFKTLDQKRFSMEVDKEETVEDLICKLEDERGRENLYRLIHAGKILKEEDIISDYTITSKIPIILMVTRAQDTISSFSESVEKFEHEHKDVDKFDSFKRTRTVTEDSGFEDECNENHFVTDAEFENVIDIIKGCEYLKYSSEPKITTSFEVQTVLETFCEDERITDPNFEEMVSNKTENIIEAHLNKKQLYALFEDLQSIYEESRNVNKTAPTILLDADDSSSDESDESEGEAKINKLTDMGFPKESVINALHNAGNNLHLAVDLLSPEIDSKSVTTSSSSLSKSNPLSFLRDIDEFQFLRYLVLQDPSQLKPLLLSFGQSHPEIMRKINQNKDIFISMLHEQTGAKLHGRH